MALIIIHIYVEKQIYIPHNPLMIKVPKRQIASLGEQVARWRRYRGLTQAELETRADLGHNALSRIETGQVSPRLSTVEQIASALDISFEELQLRKPPTASPEIREENIEALAARLMELDEERRKSVLVAFHTLLDQMETN